MAAFSSRARFLSSSKAAFIAALSWRAVSGDSQVCNASEAASEVGDNPRYIDRELQMQYGQGAGESCNDQLVRVYLNVYITRKAVNVVHSFYIW
jgi:hypothetical protein